jgi:hypothetical protein
VFFVTNKALYVAAVTEGKFTAAKHALLMLAEHHVAQQESVIKIVREAG